ncbi:MAG: hypothetical protein GXY40_11645 [Syntrophomonadaceae bacterium]|nr:hypothetical protein [Syntrophomonadaceae bacterium]
MKSEECGVDPERTWGLSLLVRLEPRNQRDCPRVRGVCDSHARPRGPQTMGTVPAVSGNW